MTYDEETRNELMQNEITEDNFREKLNEIDEGGKDAWISNNFEELKDNYLEENFDKNSNEFKEFCEMQWRELNEKNY